MTIDESHLFDISSAWSQATAMSQDTPLSKKMEKRWAHASHHTIWLQIDEQRGAGMADGNGSRSGAMELLLRLLPCIPLLP